MSSLLLEQLVLNEVDTVPDIEMFSVALLLWRFFLFHLKFNMIHYCIKWTPRLTY